MEPNDKGSNRDAPESLTWLNMKPKLEGSRIEIRITTNFNKKMVAILNE